MILVIGAGLAGLTCARLIQQSGQAVQVLEAAESVGGRVRSDQIDGYTCDHGFQVLFEAYPAVQRQLDLRALNLRAFDPGAIICRDGRRAVLTDPLRDGHPAAVLEAMLTNEVALMDKLRTLRLVLALGYSGLDLHRFQHQTTLELLQANGFSEAMIDRFFRPFFGGIFLDRSLATNAAAFAFYLEMLATGHTVIPAAGMGAITAQLAQPLAAAGVIRLNAPVVALLRDGERVTGVRLASGEEIAAEQVVLATEAPVAQRLADLPVPQGAEQTITIYFAGLRPVYSGKKLALNAAPAAFVNNAQQLSNVAPEYAPPERHLLSATILGQPELDDRTLVSRAMNDLRQMFRGDMTAQAALSSYYPLKIYRIPYAQFPQPVGIYDRLPSNTTTTPGLFVAGEWTRSSSINGAMTSGELCAAALTGVPAV